MSEKDINVEENNFNPVELNELRESKKKKAEEIRDMASGSSWWLPMNLSFFIKGEGNSLELKNDYDHQDKDVEEKTLKAMIPTACILNEKSDFQGDQYLLKFIDIDTGEIMYTPMTGGLKSGLIRETALTEDLLNRETEFDKETQKKSSVIVKYWGKIYNEDEKNSFHSYTVKTLV